MPEPFRKEYVQFETENFVIKLHRSESEIMWPYLKDVVEMAYEKYTKKYNIKPKGPKEYDGKILLLMFDKHQDFSARTVGLPGLGALGACFGQIITMPSPIMGMQDPARIGALYEYAEKLLQDPARSLPENMSIKQWYQKNKKALEKDAVNRKMNAVVAKELLKFLEKDPHHWEAVFWINEKRTKEKVSFEDYLKNWKASVLQTFSFI